MKRIIIPTIALMVVIGTGAFLTYEQITGKDVMPVANAATNDVKTANTTTAPTIDEITMAKTVIKKARVAELDKLTAADRTRNDEIVAKITAEDLELVEKKVPAWVLYAYSQTLKANFEGGMSVTTWGSGFDGARQFNLIAGRDSTGELRLDLPIVLNAERVAMINKTPYLHATSLDGGDPLPTKTSIVFTGDWRSGFCVKPEMRDSECDTAGAVEHNLITPVGTAIPEFKLQVDGRIIQHAR